MVVRVFLAGLLVSFCVATKLQYPATNPCILIDLETDNSLSWTPANGTEKAIPNWNISNFEVSDGNCTADVHYLTVHFNKDNSTLRFDFQNATGKVDVKLTLTIVPDIAFKELNNTDKNPVEIKTDLMAGSVDKAYKCVSQTIFNGTGGAGGDEYKVTYRITNLMIQGFGVENGTFSTDMEECSADQTTTAPPNTTVTTEPTTAPPNTTVTTQPTTPEPKSAPKVTLNATDGNETCAMVQAEMTLMVPYNTTSKTQKTATIYVPKSVTATGKCMNENKTDILMATWGGGWEMDFVFKGDGDNIWWDQLNLTVYYDQALFPDIVADKANKTQTFSKSFSQAFKAKSDGSYMCNSDTDTDLTNGIKLKTTDFQYTALQKNVTSFSDKNIAECSADAKTSSIVPIAVGAALAGLVVIVLIAYLIGRRRNRKGYESV